MSINLRPSFKVFFKFVHVNFVSEEMVWQTVPVFHDSHKERVLKGLKGLTLANLVCILYGWLALVFSLLQKE